MKALKASSLIAAAMLCLSCSTPKGYAPINPNATKEAKQLLEFLYSIQGQYTLAGQHNFTSDFNRYDSMAVAITGKTPVVWGADFSFNAVGDNISSFQHCGPMNLTVPFDSCTFNGRSTEDLRQSLVDKAKEMYAQGRIITLMWHRAFPTYGDTCNGDEIWTWDRRPSQETWDELTTEGTELNNAWKKQLDGVAYYLKQLQDASIPVLWRPYHEMNGKWFWWDDKPGAEGFQKLWKMEYDYLTNYHKLNNLLWVWDTNAPRDIPGDEAGPYEDYFPGVEYVDVLAADVYRQDYKQSHHDDLVTLGQGKIIALGEVGQLPTEEMYAAQPDWAWFMTWGYFIGFDDNKELAPVIYDNPRTLTLERMDFTNKQYAVKK